MTAPSVPSLPDRVGPADQAPAVDVARVQARTVRTLIASQIIGGIGVASGIAVAVLAAEELTGSASLAGLVQTAGVLGAAVAAVPLSRLMYRRGRRIGLVAAYLIAGAGAGICLLSGVSSAYWLMLLGMSLYGVATAANLAARYAATDLAEPSTRGRDLGLVVWATTIGAVLGPNLIEPGGALGEWLGVPRLFGPYLIAFTGFLVAATTLAVRMRPDPLLTARRRATELDTGDPQAGPQRSIGLREALLMIVRSPGARLGVLAVAVAHTVMVGVMVLTPVHMHHGGATLTIVGLVISVHVAAMFALSPLIGVWADRVGRVPVICVGQLILLASALVSGTASGHESAQLGIGLGLLGLGWSCCLVAGSTLITESVGLTYRPAIQGASDLVMGVSAAGGGALAGVVVGAYGYGVLNAAGAALAAVPLLVVIARAIRGAPAAA
ncbi:MAG TPA: MFS transporter [Actinomycetes bacterium]|nr:MFS transporter [Actinomycetes bacterium]